MKSKKTIEDVIKEVLDDLMKEDSEQFKESLKMSEEDRNKTHKTDIPMFTVNITYSATPVGIKCNVKHHVNNFIGAALLKTNDSIYEIIQEVLVRDFEHIANNTLMTLEKLRKEMN